MSNCPCRSSCRWPSRLRTLYDRPRHLKMWRCRYLLSIYGIIVNDRSLWTDPKCHKVYTSSDPEKSGFAKEKKANCIQVPNSFINVCMIIKYAYLIVLPQADINGLVPKCHGALAVLLIVVPFTLVHHFEAVHCCFPPAFAMALSKVSKKCNSCIFSESRDEDDSSPRQLNLERSPPSIRKLVQSFAAHWAVFKSQWLGAGSFLLLTLSAFQLPSYSVVPFTNFPWPWRRPSSQVPVYLNAGPINVPSPLYCT